MLTLPRFFILVIAEDAFVKRLTRLLYDQSLLNSSCWAYYSFIRFFFISIEGLIGYFSSWYSGTIGGGWFRDLLVDFLLTRLALKLDLSEESPSPGER